MGTYELIIICVQEEERMNSKQAESSYLSIAPPNKKGYNNCKKFNPRRRYSYNN